MAWTALRNWVPGELVTANALNQQIRDNLAVLKTPIANDGTIFGELKGYREKWQTPTFSSNIVSFDYLLGNHIILARTANINSFSISNVPPSGDLGALIMGFSGVGSAFTVTWTINAHSVRWPNASAPTMTTTSGYYDWIMVFTHDGGATWWGFIMGQVQ